MTDGEAAPGLVLAGRLLPWLLVQALALAVVGAAVATAVAWRRAGSSVSRGEQLRLGAYAWWSGADVDHVPRKRERELRHYREVGVRHDEHGDVGQRFWERGAGAEGADPRHVVSSSEAPTA